MATIRLSIVLDSGARVGPDKAALLESIRDTGSISASERRKNVGATRKSARPARRPAKIAHRMKGSG
jgi:molybdenum-dependent DNA-binding transcriptional regulator ModE